ncbi:MAG: hypothetical protein N2691_01935 [Patescibacteria group bacterium]|nr:hypothetical protein [Patescibacteria group bacterium]
MVLSSKLRKVFLFILPLLLALVVVSAVAAEKSVSRPRAESGDMQQPESEYLHLNDGRRPVAVSIDENPETINVAITDYLHCSDWLNSGQAVVRVDTIPFKDYVRNVLPNEWISTWHPEALKAGAIAVKNYGWRKKVVGARSYLQSMHNLDKPPDITDTTCDQVYLPNTSRPSTDAAVEAIWDYRITRNNALLANFYLATEAQCLASPYQPCMPQWGTQYRALEGKTWQEIVQLYYAPVNIELNPLTIVPNGLYRFWSDTYKSHFYTASVAERDYVRRSLSRNWRYETVAFVVANQSDAGSIPVYRFWSERYHSHFYTANEGEKVFVEQNFDDFTWQFEMVAFWVFPLSQEGPYREVYRFWSDTYRSHFYTASQAERDFIIANYKPVWRYEGPVWKVAQ